MTLFEMFWEAYPRRVNKKKARELFTKLIEGMTDEEGLAFVERLISDIESRIKLQQFGFDKLHPTTYLNQERWEDDLVDDRVNNNEPKSAIERRLASRSHAPGLGQDDSNVRGNLDKKLRGIH